MTKSLPRFAISRSVACAALMVGSVFPAITATVFAVEDGRAKVSETTIEAPLIPLRARADGALIFTHEADVRSHMIRIPAKWPRAVGPLAFLAKREELKAGRIFLSAEDGAAALKALAQETGQDPDLLGGPGVTVAVGNSAGVGIGPEWRYLTDWEKAPGGPESWVAKGVATRQMGLSAKVVSRLATDGGVQLSATFKWMEFDGFVEHPVPNERTTMLADFVALNKPDEKVAARGVKKGAKAAAPVYEPIFFSREVTADVRIPQGKTVVLVDEGKETGSEQGDSLLVFVSVETKPLPDRH